ncbi:MAG: DUF3109 family protein, partial [Bacteroidales bacterium]|nr:DUF3109 family protein [Bacteroidales bacterium]
PLTEEEVKILEEIFPFVKPFMRNEGIRAVEKQGTSITDFENDRVTPLINNEECAYTYLEGQVYKCAIEKAWEEGKISFRKPLSCHLFPLRMKKYSGFTAVNYQQLAICSGAVRKGNAEGIHVYEFLKEPLIRALGENIYSELCLAANELMKK